jgi:hypothetical protein
LFVVKAALVFILALASISAALGITDPARDYLSTFSPLGGDNAIYSSDTLLRLELDLDGDGQYEVLLSMARDQDGKLGNVWAVFAKTPTGYTKIGTMTFNPKSFYLGPIEDLGDYGLVTFKPTGEGTGTLSAYLFNGASLRNVEITSVTPDTPTRDPELDRPVGQAIVDKYMRQAADATGALTSSNAGDLAKKYDLKVAGKKPAPTISSSTIPSPSSADQSASPRSTSQASRSLPWIWGIIVLVLVAIGWIAWAKRR